MKQGGTFVMVAPPNPYRCPPGPYERASLIANYIKKNNIKSKVLVLDANQKIVSKGKFVLENEGIIVHNNKCEKRNK